MTENITLEEAKRMAEKAIEKAKEIGIKISVAVYDVNGHLVLLEKMDDAAWKLRTSLWEKHLQLLLSGFSGRALKFWSRW
jgi:Uncharacterized protein, possibly involved in utilization of glycolate and propanediol